MRADFEKDIPIKLLQRAELPVMEAFYTVQGEGFHTGSAAYFIRTAGCDVGCHWCDVKESWDEHKHPLSSVKNIIEGVLTYPAEIVVVTGGEPLMHDLDILTAALKTHGKRTHIETSGAHPLSGHWDWICFSPKKFKAPLQEFYKKSHELKIVIFHPSDLEWAEEHARQMNPSGRLFLQPEWSRKEKIMPLLVEYVKDNPHWRISLQTHKYLDIP